MTDAIVLTITRDIAAPPERVFDAWLDPAIAGQFLFRTDAGELIECTIDAREGGRALIVERRASGDARHHLKYVTIDRPHRLDMLFAADPAEEGQWTRLSLTFAAIDSGTRLTLVHEMDPEWAAYEAQTRAGWTMILNTLSQVMEKNDD